MAAQGEALGRCEENRIEALKERGTWIGTNDVALSGLRHSIHNLTQGCALGFHIMPFQGSSKPVMKFACTCIMLVSKGRARKSLAYAAS